MNINLPEQELKEVRKIKKNSIQASVYMSATPIQAKNKQLMTVKNLTSKSADLYIYGEIVDNSDWKWDESEVMPDDVLQALNTVDGLDELNIYINSPGGSVFAGQAIYNMLNRNKAKKNVYIDGVAASMASIIAMVGDTINIPTNAFLMIHKPLTIAIGNATDFRKLADDLDTIETGLVNVYEENLKEGVNIDTIKDLMEKETWLTGNEAAEYFNVEVIESKNIAACGGDLLARYEKTPQKLVAVVKEEPHSNNEDDKIKFQNELDLLEL